MKFDAVAKAWFIKEAAEMAAKNAKKAAKKLKKIDWDEDVLQRVGLTVHKPGWGFLGGASLILLGAAVGGLTALMLAPKKGEELRTDMLKYMTKEPELTVTPPVTTIEMNPTARV